MEFLQFVWRILPFTQHLEANLLTLDLLMILKVTNVWEEGEDIWHQVDGFPTNEVISGSVDWTRRFDHMQQHTGQHLLSAVIFNEFQSNTIGFHIGPDTSTIDLDIQKLTMDAIAIIENMVNSKVWDNYPIEIKISIEFRNTEVGV